MANSLTNELIQLQRSRRGFKYAELVDDYVREFPDKIGDTINKPISSLNKNIQIITRYRGKMLYNLEKRFYASWKRIMKYTRQAE